jgi:hypothetical protein
MVVNYLSMSSMDFGVPDFKNRGRGTRRITESPGMGTVPKFPALQERRILWHSQLSRPVWLLIIVIHFDWPKQMRERELGELPLAIFLGIHLSHHKRIGDFVLTDYCLQINVL